MGLYFEAILGSQIEMKILKGVVAMLGSEPEKFDARWYLKRYPDVAGSGMDPREHYELFGKSEGREAHGTSILKRISIHLHNFRAFYWLLRTRAGGVRATVRKIVQVADREGLIDRGFDKAFYLEKYPDVRASGLHPYQHYLLHGRNEGRAGIRQALPLVAGGRKPQNDRAKVLVVSHEASVTGAPVLSLNVTRKLSIDYDVVTLIIGPGSLYEAFRSDSISIIGPVARKHHGVAFDDLIEQLLEKYSFDFALVNSIECERVLEPLGRRSVPVVMLIHEFASYTRPRDAFRSAFFWSNEVVFSTKLTYQDAVDLYPDLIEKQCAILPQGQCRHRQVAVCQDERKKEISRIRDALKPPGFYENDFLIVGVGYVQMRKGVDYFIDCAAKVKALAGTRRCRFVWVGDGYDPENDMGYSVYLADQIRRAGLQHDIRIIGSTSEIDEVYREADLLLITSRLDPLPNVAIDAMIAGLPTLCFEGTTGIAQILVEGGLGGACVSAYLNTTDMARKVRALAEDPDAFQQVADITRDLAQTTFNLDRYVSSIIALSNLAKHKVAKELEVVRQFQDLGQLDPEYLNIAGPQVTAVDFRWRYLRPWECGFGMRKPFAGFHPGIYHASRGIDMDSDPLVDYLKAGRPRGPWQLEVIGPKAPLALLPRSNTVALQLHVYFPDILGDIINRIGRNKIRPDLFISVPSREVAELVDKELYGYKSHSTVSVVPNRGRDIGPFLTEFGPQLREYKYIGHLHTKKSQDVADSATGKKWREFLFENLVGGRAPMADIILSRMEEDSSLGLVFPDDPNMVGWGKNRPFADELASRLGLEEPLQDYLFFPVGTMFWARSDALAPLFQAGFDWEDYPTEPLPYDGTILHALERLLPAVVRHEGKRCAVTHVPGVVR